MKQVKGFTVKEVNELIDFVISQNLKQSELQKKIHLIFNFVKKRGILTKQNLRYNNLGELQKTTVKVIPFELLKRFSTLIDLSLT